MAESTFLDPMGEDDVWYYCGDINLEEGGVFYTLSDNCSAVDVIPYDDNEDERCWYVIEDKIFVDDNHLESALKNIGYKASEGMTSVTDTLGGSVTGLDARRLVIEAFHAYRGLDDSSNPIFVKESDLDDKKLAQYIHDEYLGNEVVIGGPRGMPSQEYEDDSIKPGGM